MPSFDEPILRMAREVADINRGGKFIEEEADAIGRFVTSLFSETRTVRRSAPKRSGLRLNFRGRLFNLPLPPNERRLNCKPDLRLGELVPTKSAGLIPE